MFRQNSVAIHYQPLSDGEIYLESCLSRVKKVYLGVEKAMAGSQLDIILVVLDIDVPVASIVRW